MNIFKDFPHNNKVEVTDKHYIVKGLSEKKIIKKEFYVMDYLFRYSFVPKVIKFTGNSFKEERLRGAPIKKFGPDTIKQMALTLKKLHSLEIPSSIKKYAKNIYLKKGKYDPVKILRLILDESPNNFKVQYEEKLVQIAKKVNLHLKVGKNKISLIHGDLNYGNIFIINRKIFITDWTDCRLDIPSCDVAQLFYLLRFTEKQQKLFLRYYNSSYLTNELLTFNKILLVVFDITHFYIYRKKCPGKYYKKLDSYLYKFYDR